MPIDEELLINSERRLWAMMFTDLEGFSRKTRDFGILHFLQVILESKKLLLPVVHEHGGLLLEADGDSMFLLFRTPRRAVGEHECSGREVNAASKLGEDTAEPHQVFVTESVANAVGQSIDGVSFRLIGDTAAGAKRNHEVVFNHYQEAAHAG